MNARRWLRWLLVALGGGTLAFVAVSAFFAWRFTGPMRRPLEVAAAQFLDQWEDVRFPARDGVKLAGWFAAAGDSRRAVVLLHGHGSRRTQMLARARFFHDRGYAVLLYDARGHGESAGELVSFGWLETRDLLGALDWLRARGFSEFGCVGVSQGGATIALAAAEFRDVRWAVLESVFPDLATAVDRRFQHMLGLPGWIAGGLMVPMAEWRLGRRATAISPRDTIAQLGCPALFMSGDCDAHTTPADARAVFDQAPGKKSFWLVPGAAHVDLYGHAKREYEEHIDRFLASLGRSP